MITLGQSFKSTPVFGAIDPKKIKKGLKFTTQKGGDVVYEVENRTKDNLILKDPLGKPIRSTVDKVKKWFEK